MFHLLKHSCKTLNRLYINTSQPHLHSHQMKRASLANRVFSQNASINHPQLISFLSDKHHYILHWLVCASYNTYLINYHQRIKLWKHTDIQTLYQTFLYITFTNQIIKRVHKQTFHTEYYIWPAHSNSANAVYLNMLRPKCYTMVKNASLMPGQDLFTQLHTFISQSHRNKSTNRGEARAQVWGGTDRGFGFQQTLNLKH